jgi:hypothetical protein
MTRLSALALIVAAAALGLLVGGRVGGEPPAAVNVVAATAPATANLPAPAPAATRAPAPAQPAPVAAAAPPQPRPQPQREPAPSGTFWHLVGATRAEAGNDTGRQSELLDERLRQLSPQAIVEFSQTRRTLDRRAYTWAMWGAAATIEDGCSDDCFRDFRAYVISLGQTAYEQALRNPDSLATVAQGAENGDWENADDVAPDAYSSVTGGDFPLDDSDLSGPPSGTPISLDNASELARRYPRLAARFR